MEQIKKRLKAITPRSAAVFVLGLIIAALLAAASQWISGFIPYHLISGGVFAMLIGMLLHPLVIKIAGIQKGFAFVGKKILKLAIVLMGVSLSFSQVLEVGKYSLLVMVFTLLTAFGGGYLLGKLFHMNWRLSSLISAGTGICGGSAIAAISPVIEAEDSDVAYAISATFLFDILMVILFPIAGHAFGMTDMGFGLWAGTAVNDTSSVVAAGYAFSDAAGNYAIIVKLTRTLSIIPAVLLFSFIQMRAKRKEAIKSGAGEAMAKVKWSKIFPWFILLFLGMVVINSLGVIPQAAVGTITGGSKFCMVMALGAIGLNTDFRKVAKSGFKPMLHGFLISALVVVVSFLVQLALGQV